MALVKQVRVLLNIVCLAVLCILVLWLVRDRLWEHCDALGLGAVAGGIGGWCWWRHLARFITRRDRRYERNKIFVHYLNIVEVVIVAVAYNHYLAIPLGVVLLAGVLFTSFSAHRWTVFIGSSGLVGLGVLAGYISWYERHHGPLYYQYDNEGWSGAEGMLYQRATVVQPLTPAGKVKIQGVLWNAVSLSRETIDVGEQVEVISTERLTLYVDRLPHPTEPSTTSEQ
jgi:membrane protein implicated in regulation of membrane protease activity